MSKPDAIGLEGNEPQGREQDGKRQLARSAGRRAICVSVAPLIIDLAPGTAGVHSALPPYRTGGIWMCGTCRSAGYHVTCGVSPDPMEASRMAAMQMIDLPCRRHNLSAMDAYLLCSVCADFVINELVNRPIRIVSLYYLRLVLE
jgi:hypothetical protein